MLASEGMIGFLLHRCVIWMFQFGNLQKEIGEGAEIVLKYPQGFRGLGYDQ